MPGIGDTTTSYLLVNNGAIVQSSLVHCDRTEEWVLQVIHAYGYKRPSELFCLEWTPGRGFYLVAKSGDVKRGDEEFDVEKIGPEVLN